MDPSKQVSYLLSSTEYFVEEDGEGKKEYGSCKREGKMGTAEKRKSVSMGNPPFPGNKVDYQGYQGFLRALSTNNLL